MDQVAQDVLRVVGGIQIGDGVGDLVLHKEVHVDDVVIAGDHGAFLGVGDGLALIIGDVAQLDLLIHVDVHLFGLLDAEGQLEVQTGGDSVGDLTEGGDHRHLLIVYRVDAGNGGQDQQRHRSDDGDGNGDLLAVNGEAFVILRRPLEVVCAVRFHIECYSFYNNVDIAVTVDDHISGKLLFSGASTAGGGAALGPRF